VQGKPVDYRKIRAEYVRSPAHISVRALAAKWGMSGETLGKRASREGWAAQRDAYWAKVEAVAESNAIDRYTQVLDDVIDPDRVRGVLEAAAKVAESPIHTGTKDRRLLLEMIGLIGDRRPEGGTVGVHLTEEQAERTISNIARFVGLVSTARPSKKKP